MTKFLAPETQILAKICSTDPSFKPKKSDPEILFLKTWAVHTYPNFCRLPPPGDSYSNMWKCSGNDGCVERVLVNVLGESIHLQCLPTIEQPRTCASLGDISKLVICSPRSIPHREILNELRSGSRHSHWHAHGVGSVALRGAPFDFQGGMNVGVRQSYLFFFF